MLSALGANGNDAADTRRTGTANIMAAMRSSDMRRFVVVGGFHLHVPGDPGNLGQRLILPILRLSKNLVEDTTAMGAVVLESDLDWTLVRIPRVVHGQATHSAADRHPQARAVEQGHAWGRGELHAALPGRQRIRPGGPDGLQLGPSN